MDEPLTLTLDIKRKLSSDEAQVTLAALEDYEVHCGDDNFAPASFPWDEEMNADLAALQSTSLALEARQRMGHRLASFLKGTCWTKMEEKIVAAKNQGEYVILTIRSKAAEVHRLPFELLTLEGSDQPLGRLPNLCIRYELLGDGLETKPEDPNPRPEGGRILLAHSAAEDIALTASKLQESISTSMATAGWSFDAKQDVLPSVTLAALRECLGRKDRQSPLPYCICSRTAGQKDSFFPKMTKNRHAASMR